MSYYNNYINYKHASIKFVILSIFISPYKKKKNWFVAAKSHGKHKKSCMKSSFTQLFLGPTTMENLVVGNRFP